MTRIEEVLENRKALERLREMRSVNTTKIAEYMATKGIVRERDSLPYTGKWVMNALKSTRCDMNVIEAVNHFYEKYANQKL